LSQGDASCADALVKNDQTNVPAVRASTKRKGTMTIIRRLYSQARPQTIELLVMPLRKLSAKVD
jgi:hypothetical protein